MADEAEQLPERSPQHGFGIGRKVKRITSTDVREATVEVKPTTGAVLGVLTTGTRV